MISLCDHSFIYFYHLSIRDIHSNHTWARHLVALRAWSRVKLLLCGITAGVMATSFTSIICRYVAFTTTTLESYTWSRYVPGLGYHYSGYSGYNSLWLNSLRCDRNFICNSKYSVLTDLIFLQWKTLVNWSVLNHFVQVSSKHIIIYDWIH